MLKGGEGIGALFPSDHPVILHWDEDVPLDHKFNGDVLQDVLQDVLREVLRDVTFLGLRFVDTDSKRMLRYPSDGGFECQSNFPFIFPPSPLDSWIQCVINETISYN